MTWVDTTGLSNAAVLAALYAQAACDAYAASKIHPTTITLDEANELLERRPDVGELHHRWIKVHFEPDGFDATQYDAKKGRRGAAQRIVDQLRAELVANAAAG